MSEYIYENVIYQDMYYSNCLLNDNLTK